MSSPQQTSDKKGLLPLARRKVGRPPESGPADMIVRGNQIQGGSDGEAENARGDSAPAGRGGPGLVPGAVGGRRLPQTGGERGPLPPLGAALQRCQSR